MKNKTHFEEWSLWKSEAKIRDLVHPEVSSTPKTETDVYIAYRAAVARWPAARITLRQGARVVYESGQWQ